MTRVLGWALFPAPLAAVVMWIAVPAEAQAVCMDRDKLVEQLASKYGETQKHAAPLDATRAIEVWASEDKGTWTLLLTSVRGVSCIVASGVAYEAVSVVEGDPA